MSISLARKLLGRARAEPERLRRHLLVAAALRELLPHEPIVVGGTAEEFWTADEYHETDLDLCAPIDRESEAALARAGFRRHGRHWQSASVSVVVEFPDSRIDGDLERIRRIAVDEATAAVIGVEDLYLDRVRQATVSWPSEDVRFDSALAIARARFELLDWRYVRRRLREIAGTEPLVGGPMKRIDSAIRRRVRRALEQT